MITLPMMDRKPMFFSTPTKKSSDRNVLVLPLFLRVSLVHNPLDMFNDHLESGPWAEIASDTLLLQERLILIWNNSTAHEQDIVSTFFPDELGNLGKSCHVSAVEKTHSYNINILVNSHLRNLFGRRQKPGVYYFHACVAEGTR